MTQEQQQFNYIYYGTRCDSGEITGFLEHVISTNEKAEAEGRPKTPTCIWGHHGIGKTQLVEQLAKEKGYKYAYIAPAQFEEMGDLVGMPKIDEYADGGRSTTFVAPEWVPREEGPGILLIDDVNRADDRILRGIMQLLQNYELVSWKLPAHWHIVLTANPDGGDYSVTPMDFAMITRMMHITMVFDPAKWALWAERNHVDPRGINFVLTYPETVTGERTTPRTLTQFFESIRDIEDLESNLGLVKMLGDSCLDEMTVAAFISFVNNQMSRLISPQEIVEASDFKSEVAEPLREQVEGETRRVDILAVICTRLVNYLIVKDVNLEGESLENMKQFMGLDFLTNELRLQMAKDLVAGGNDTHKKLMHIKEVATVLLSSGGSWFES